MGFIMNQENLQKLNVWLDNHPLIDKCSLVLEDVPNPDMSRHDEIVDRIRAAWLVTQEALWDVDDAYLPNEMWNKSVKEIRDGFVTALLTGDNLGDYFKNFWRNECSEHLIKYATFNTLQEFGAEAQSYYKYRLLHDSDVWREFSESPDLKQLTLPPIGNPFGCNLNGTLLTGSSLHSNYYAEKIDALIQGIERPVVAEIGGGSGVMAYYLLQRNSSLRYLNFDLPEILAVSQYFLMMALPDRKFKLFGEEVEDFDIALLPNFSIADMADNSCDVVANIHSLSEMTREAVDEYSKQISRICKGYFYHENSVVHQEYNETPLVNFKPEGFRRIYTAPAIWGEPIYREFCWRRA